MHETFMPPPKPDVLEPHAEPNDAPPVGQRWLTAAIWTALALAGLCFALLVLVDRAYGWPAYAAVFTASVCTVVRARASR
jgi:hypothetical protein